MCIECHPNDMYKVHCHTSLKYDDESEYTFLSGKEYVAYVFYSDVDECYLLSAIYNESDDMTIAFGIKENDRIENFIHTEMFRKNFDLVEGIHPKGFISERKEV